jgi:hypothetical protein
MSWVAVGFHPFVRPSGLSTLLGNMCFPKGLAHPESQATYLSLEACPNKEFSNDSTYQTFYENGQVGLQIIDPNTH